MESLPQSCSTPSTLNIKYSMSESSCIGVHAGVHATPGYLGVDVQPLPRRGKVSSGHPTGVSWLGSIRGLEGDFIGSSWKGLPGLARMIDRV